jgi:hypothetical protein
MSEGSSRPQKTSCGIYQSFLRTVGEGTAGRARIRKQLCYYEASSNPDKVGSGPQIPQAA